MEISTLQKLKADFLENVSVSVSFQDCNQFIHWGNQAYQSITGHPLSKIAGQKCYSVWGRTKPCRYCPVLVALQTGEAAEAKVIIENAAPRHGIRFQWLVKAMPVKNSAGMVIGAMETTFDLTNQMIQLEEQKKTIDALFRLFDYAHNHSSQDLLREFLDEAEMLTKSHIGFYHFVEADQKTLSLQMWSSRTRHQCKASGARTHYPIWKAGVWVDCVQQAAPVIHNHYESLPHKKGYPQGHVKIMRELVVPIIRGGKLMAILGVGNKDTDYDAHDVQVVSQLSELAWETVTRKRTEEEKERLQEQFAQAQKMESIGRLAGGVAHDFNNMLSVIIGHVDQALKEIDPDQSLHRDLASIRLAAERSANLTRQLLAFARQQTITPKVLNLNDIISDMLQMLRRLIGEDIDLEWRPEKNLGQVKMDPVQINQILANLCINARDAIADIGKVTIETHNANFDAAYCEDHPGFSPGAFVMLAVSDNGCGINQKVLPHIFEPFFTSKKAGKGTGLGLSTVYGIVKQNKGFINVYSEPGQGTTLRIYLSRHMGQQETTCIDPVEVSPDGGTETILLVEDEAMILNFASKMLESLGYRVLTASSPNEALSVAKAQKTAIDLLLTDVVMPEMNGQDLAAALKTLFPDIQTLFMSGYTANHIVRHGVLKPGIVFLQKPFSKSELAVKIREVIVTAPRD